MLALNSASNSNQDAVVEVVVDDRLSFIENHKAALRWLLANFGIRSICVRVFVLELKKLAIDIVPLKLRHARR
jgi:hypothetical protein